MKGFEYHDKHLCMGYRKSIQQNGEYAPLGNTIFFKDNDYLLRTQKKHLSNDKLNL